jgi:hypothetical protein
MNKLAIERPFFLTWLGTYYMIYHSDTFIALDTCLFRPKTDFRSLWHRNNFKTNGNAFTLPISFEDEQDVSTLKISTEIKYIRHHITGMEKAMIGQPFTKDVFNQIVKPVYLSKHEYLIDFNMDIIFKVCQYLGIRTDHIKRSSELDYTILNGMEDYENVLEQEECSRVLVSEGRFNAVAKLKFSTLKDRGNIDLDDFIIKPVKNIIPNHFNILEVLCEYGKDTIQLLNND